MRSYKLYIFDFDDTLVLTYKNVINFHYPSLAEHLGIEYKGPEIAKQSWGGHLSEVLPELFNGNSSIYELLETLRKLHVQYPIEAAPGANHILNILKKHEKCLAIATAGDLPMVETGIVKSLGVEPTFFDYLYSTKTHGTHKPSAEIIPTVRQAVENRRQIEVPLQDIVYIGDALADFKCAQLSGVDFYAVTSGRDQEEDFLNAGLPSNRIFSDISQAIVPEAQHGIVALIQNELKEYLLVQEGRRNSPYYGAWSGPHGRCQPEDVLEEETVVREVLEECGIDVLPIKKVYEREADTKIKTVAFWQCKSLVPSNEARIADPIEISELQWCPLDKITSGTIELYTGTKDYFFNHLV